MPGRGSGQGRRLCITLWEDMPGKLDKRRRSVGQGSEGRIQGAGVRYMLAAPALARFRQSCFGAAQWQPDEVSGVQRGVRLGKVLHVQGLAGAKLAAWSRS